MLESYITKYICPVAHLQFLFQKSYIKSIYKIPFNSTKVTQGYNIWHTTYPRGITLGKMKPVMFISMPLTEQHQKCWRYRHEKPVICPSVKLHGGKLQYSAGIMVFSSSKVTLNMQPLRQQVINEYGHKSSCLHKPISKRREDVLINILTLSRN